jgi:O-antigen ligase
VREGQHDRRRGSRLTIFAEAAPATRGEHLALRVLQFGAIAVVLSVSQYVAFELDRFFVPKELAFHLAVALAAICGAHTFTRVSATRIDRLIALYLLLSAISALFATNRWLAFRALAISASSALLFWLARGLRAAGIARPLIGALALAVILAAITALLQTYGVASFLFSENRAPGGTLGNRNFIAHVAAFGLPLVLLAALRAHVAFLIRAGGVALVVATLVLTRSRAAWLAFAAVMIVFFLSMIVSSSLRRDARTWRRMFAILLITAGGVGAALVIPNTLHWRGRDPYMQSMRRVADYQQGSGRGRLVQYTQSLSMALHHPLFGAGPGNWPVVYPEHAVRNDPSMNESEPGTTANPWPSSDWVACLSERGFASFIVFALILLGIAVNAVRQLFAARDADEALIATALLGTIAGAGISGLFDAVLLLAVPAFLVWATIGALLVPPPEPRPLRKSIVIVIMLTTVLGAARSAMQLAAMRIYSTGSDRASLSRGAQLDPGNFRLQLRLARAGGRERCAHALAARSLFPNAKAAIDLSRGCGDR